MRTGRTIEPIIWESSRDARAIVERFDRDGVCWVRRSDAVELATCAPDQLIESLLGWAPLATHVNQIRVVQPTRPGPRPYAVTNDEARFHIDQHPYLPPAVQVLVCVRQASDPGGASMFIDTWELLEELIAAHDPLLAKLFETQRIVRFHNFAWCGPTLSLRDSSLVAVHNGFPLEGDDVGARFQQLLERRERVRFRLETGDLLISNNHRTLHARTAFADTKRHLTRILCWPDRPLAAPDHLIARAAQIAARTDARACNVPSWIRKRLGYSGSTGDHYTAADLLAHYRGELSEDVAREDELLRAHAQLWE